MSRAIRILVIAIAFIMTMGTVACQARVKQKRRVAKKERKVQAPKKTEVGKLNMIEYHYQGMMMMPVARVKVERVGGKVVLTANDYSEGDESFTIDDGEKLLEEAKKIILEENMLDYASSYKLDSSIQVLDGYDWSFAAKFADGRSVSSYGSNVKPDGNGLKRIQQLLYDKAEAVIKEAHEKQ